MCDCLDGDLIGMGWFGSLLLLLLWSSVLAVLVWGLDRLFLRRLRDRTSAADSDEASLLE